MLELSILRFFTRDIIYYNKYYNTIKDISLEKELKILLSVISKYYNQFNTHNYIGQEELTTFFLSEYPKLKDQDQYLQIIARIYSLDISDSLATDVIRKLLEVHTANRLVNELLPIVSGQEFGLEEKIDSVMEQYKRSADKQREDEPFVNASLSDLFQAKASDGLTWRLKGLQDTLGCLSGGTLGHFFARPETGKTTLLHSEASNFVQQLQDAHPLLWINNEEDANTVKLRFYSAVCGASVDQIKAHMQQAEKVFAERGGHRMKLFDSAAVSVSDVELLCKTWKPRIVLIDQGDKLTYKGQDKAGNGADRLKYLNEALREISKRCNREWKMDMITIGQADAPAEGKKWLFQTNLDGGKTGKAGAFDYIIGIGKTYIDAEENTRYIHACKNKLTGRHEKFIATIDTAKARYS